MHSKYMKIPTINMLIVVIYYYSFLSDNFVYSFFLTEIIFYLYNKYKVFALWIKTFCLRFL